jgi:D-3-phosphoglycerate dehydrogenase
LTERIGLLQGIGIILGISDTLKIGFRNLWFRRAFFKQNAHNIYIISNGFKEIIIPIVQEYGIKPEQVLANTFKFDHEGNIIVLMRRYGVRKSR